MKHLFFVMAGMLFWGHMAVAEVINVGGKAVYDVDMAKAESELERGLMNVYELPEDKGMLFDLRAYRGGSASMWMKDTYIALDMIFIGCDMRVVDIYENAEPLSLKKIGSETDFCYVLEINGKEVEKHGIAKGDLVLYPDTE